MSLFRDKITEQRRRKIYGGVSLWQPISLSVYSFFGFISLSLIILFLAFGKYSKKETVIGWISPSLGVSEVYATRGGVLSDVLIKQGDTIKQGEVIAKFAIDISGPNGAIAPIQRQQTNSRIEELRVQANASQIRFLAEDSRLLEQQKGLNLKYSQDDSRLLGNINALKTETEQLAISRDMAQQNLLLEEKTLSRMKQVVGDGALSPLEIDRQTQAVISARSQFQESMRRIESLKANIADVESQRSILRAQYVSSEKDLQKQRALISPLQTNEASQMRSAKSQLESNIADLSISDGYVVRAPISGKVVSINLRVGESANNVPIAAIVPENANLEAELLLPTRSAGFVKSGMKVRVMVDAFPYQKFGIIKAEINEITNAAFRPGEIKAPIDFKEPMYRVRAKINAENLKVYGTPPELQSGMTIKADIITDTRSFLMWLLDPLLAAKAKYSAN